MLLVLFVVWAETIESKKSMDHHIRDDLQKKNCCYLRSNTKAVGGCQRFFFLKPHIENDNKKMKIIQSFQNQNPRAKIFEPLCVTSFLYVSLPWNLYSKIFWGKLLLWWCPNSRTTLTALCERSQAGSNASRAAEPCAHVGWSADQIRIFQIDSSHQKFTLFWLFESIQTTNTIRKY